MTELLLFKVAKAGYNAMKEYGENIDQPYMPEWGESKELQDMAVNSIERMLKNYFETYFAHNIKIVMSPETSHGLWAFDALSRGWHLGQRFSLKGMTNPRLRKFSDLEKKQQGKSSVIVSVFREYLPLLEEEYWQSFQPKPERDMPRQQFIEINNLRNLNILPENKKYSYNGGENESRKNR